MPLKAKTGFSKGKWVQTSDGMMKKPGVKKKEKKKEEEKERKYKTHVEGFGKIINDDGTVPPEYRGL